MAKNRSRAMNKKEVLVWRAGVEKKNAERVKDIFFLSNELINRKKIKIMKMFEQVPAVKAERYGALWHTK